MKTIVALSSNASNSGKTTLARHLVDLGFCYHPFSEPFKSMLKVLFGNCNCPTDDKSLSIVDVLYGDHKDVRFPELGGKSARELMISLGNDWGRKLVTPDIWVNLSRNSIETCSSDLIIIDDLRQPNELEFLRGLDPLTYRVVLGYIESTRKSSKLFPVDNLLDPTSFDFRVTNSDEITVNKLKRDFVLRLKDYGIDPRAEREVTD